MAQGRAAPMVIMVMRIDAQHPVSLLCGAGPVARLNGAHARTLFPIAQSQGAPSNRALAASLAQCMACRAARSSGVRINLSRAAPIATVPDVDSS